MVRLDPLLAAVLLRIDRERVVAVPLDPGQAGAEFEPRALRLRRVRHVLDDLAEALLRIIEAPGGGRAEARQLAHHLAEDLADGTAGDTPLRQFDRQFFGLQPP